MTIKRVLIVEDQGIIALDEVEIVRDLGYEVTGIALTGESAVDQAGRDRPDLVLMDIMLPGKMDGRQAAAKIRERHEIPVIFVTALGDKKTAQSGKMNLPDGVGYIVKPFSRQELKDEIRRLIG
jgi:CheY-like chemotaxis protein